MSFNYVVSAQKPTAVTHSVTGSFTGPEDRNLIVAKFTRLEIYLMTPDGLQPQFDVSVYGRIASMGMFRPAGMTQDLLFLLTERYQFTLLAYDTATGEIVTRAKGALKERIGRPAESGPIGIADPDCRVLGFHLYDGLFKVVPLGPGGALREAFAVRMDELRVIDLKFLHCCAAPTLCVLYQDTREARHVRTYTVQLGDAQELATGPWAQSNVEAGASMLIPVPAPFGGVLVVGQQTIAYINGADFRTMSIPSTIIRSHGLVDPNGSRILLGDHNGGLHVLVLLHDGAQVNGLNLEPLGETSISSTLSYLDGGVVFVGSAFGDSQLVKLNAEKDGAGSYVEVLEAHANLGPIVDFAVVDLERQGQGQVVTCSGAYKDGSLRVVRNGIGINEQAAVELPGIKGMWALRPGGEAVYHKFLVQSFIGETRVLAMEGEEMGETELPGFDCALPTLYCGNMAAGCFLQVTPAGARLVDAETLQLVHQWQPDVAAGQRITVASANQTQALLALGGGALVYLELDASARRLAERARAAMEQEVACLTLHPLRVDAAAAPAAASGMDVDADADAREERAAFAAVGMWTDVSVRVLRLPSLEQASREPLGGDVIPRSVLLLTMEGVHYLLVALGDGHLLAFHFNPAAGTVSNRKRVALGTQPISLATFRSKDAEHVFAASDRPTVIFSSNRKLLYSNVNLKEVTVVSPFHSASFPDCLAIASEEELTIGTIDEIQKLHIRTVPLGEQPRRIAHVESADAFAVATVKLGVDANGDMVETGFVRLVDATTFEVLSSLQLDPYEQPCSMVTCKFADDGQEYVVVGTAFVLEDESEPSEGRIVVMEVVQGPAAGAGSASPAAADAAADDADAAASERRLVMVSEKSSKGAVSALNSFQGKLLAAVNSKVQLLKWARKEDGTKELISECGHHCHILALYLQSRGDYIVVGDLMKSIALLQYSALDGSISEVADDGNMNWMAALDMLSEDVYIGAEAAFNIFTLRRNVTATTEEDRRKLDVVGQFHVGDFVNCFRSGSLVMHQSAADAEAADAAAAAATATAAAATAASSGAADAGAASASTAPATASAAAAVDADEDAGSDGLEVSLSAKPALIFGGVSGALGVICSLRKPLFVFLKRLEKALNRVIRGVGGLQHDEWRAFENERYTVEAHGFVDGDLVESFLDLHREKMEQVVRALNEDGAALPGAAPVTVEDLTRMVEELSRLH